jgi:asparagine synthase (glutamine-hydrolysing)
LAVNGEIYNHVSLKNGIDAAFSEYSYKTSSDCEVILAACENLADHTVTPLVQLLNKLEGMFAFVYWDSKRERAIVGRDPFGIIPLYYATTDRPEKEIYFASEMKSLPSDDLDQAWKTSVNLFPPGHFAIVENGEIREMKQWFSYRWTDAPRTWNDPAELASRLEREVQSHLMTDVPYGVLLSGGLDSSLVAALVCRHARRRVESLETEKAWYPRVHSFSVGLENSPDLAKARLVADALSTVHHEIKFTVQQALEMLPEVIRHIETYDTTTVRASTPMVILARAVHAMGIKMVLSGEGADEIMAGYLYFAKAPTPEDLRQETVDKVRGLHQFDCLRANKSMMAYSVELRVPFLSTPFVNYAMELDPALKMVTEKRPMEKHLLRSAFADLGLPDEVLWRQKEQFSDGVGFSWIDGLKRRARELYPDFSREEAAQRFPVNPPRTEEEMMIRAIFEQEFGSSESRARTVPWGSSIACSTSRVMEWDASFRNRADPSGRAVKHHSAFDNTI